MNAIKSIVKIERDFDLKEFKKVLVDLYGEAFIDIKFNDQEMLLYENGETSLLTIVDCSFAIGGPNITFEHNVFFTRKGIKTYISLPYTEINAKIIENIAERINGWYLERNDVNENSFVKKEKKKAIKRIDIMTDIETLGKGNMPPVFQIAAAAFDIETGNIFETFNETADISKLENIEGDTLVWWLNTNKELLTELLNKGKRSGISEEQLIKNIVEWIKSLAHKYNIDTKEIYFWGNGILFDNRIIKNKCMQYGIEYPIFYRSDRDMRTIVELAGRKTGIGDENAFRNSVKIEGLTAHDAFDDVRQQIAVVSAAYKAIMN